MNSKITWKHSQEDISSLEGSDSLLEGDSTRWEFASDSRIRRPGTVPHLSYGKCLCVLGTGTIESFHGLRPLTAKSVSTSSSESLESSTSDESVYHSRISSGLLTKKCYVHNANARSESKLNHLNYIDGSWYAGSNSADPSSNNTGIHSLLIEDRLCTFNMNQSDTNSTSSSVNEHSLELNVDSISSEEEEEQI